MLRNRVRELLTTVRDGSMRLGAARTADLNMIGSSKLKTVIQESAIWNKRKVAREHSSLMTAELFCKHLGFQKLFSAT